MKRAHLILITLTVTWAPAGVAKPPASAERWRAAVRAATAAGDPRAVAQAYAEWSRQDPDVRVILNEANAWEQADDCARALEALGRARARCGACEHRDLIAFRAEPLRERCGGPTADSEVGRSLRAPKITRRVEGAAALVAGRRSQARDQAVRAAQVQALQLTSDTYVEVLTVAQQREAQTSKGNDYQSMVSEVVKTRSAGMVAATKIIREWEEGGELRVEVEVEVDNTALLREMKVLARRYAQARFPKIMFVVQEEYTDKKGETSKVAEPVLLALLESEFVARGFDVVDRARTREIQAQRAALFDEVVRDPSKAAELALEQGADYIITAVARVRYTSENDLKSGDVHGTAEISARCVAAGSGQVISNESPPVGTSPPAVFSEQEMRAAAVRHVGAQIVRPTIDHLVDAWLAAQERGVRYAVTLLGAPNSRAGNVAFSEVLREVPGVTLVKSVADAPKLNRFEVFFTALYDVGTLKKEVLAGTRARAELAKVSLYASTMNELTFVFPGHAPKP